MKVSKISIIIACIAIILFLSGSVSAWFPEVHAFETLRELRSDRSPGSVGQLCIGRERQVLFGDLGADATVVHYLDENTVGSYIGTHTRGLYTECLDKAGTDMDLRCMCYGIGLHQVQDPVSHYQMTPKYIKKIGCTNVLCHALIELNANGKFLDELKAAGDEYVDYDELIELTRTVYGPAIKLDDPLYDEKYLDLWIEITGESTITQDMNVVGNSLYGDTWYDEVHNKKVNIPQAWHNIWIMILVIGIVILSYTIYYIRKIGRSPSRTTGVAVGIVVLLIGLFLASTIIPSSLPTSGKSWVFFNYIGRPVGSLFIDVTDWQSYISQVNENTRTFMNTQEIFGPDASGLDHVDDENNLVNGPLDAAEGTFKYVVGPIIFIIIAVLMTLLFWRIRVAKGR